ncbi:MAG TPA: hypothetical protein ENK98_03090 [Epsilonproteobacteria bacterium]|nr:hypothetical protein [Campylobacterota bacterium]
MNIADVKRELSGDEKVLESAFKLETLYKKYKFIIWTVVIGLILFFVGRTVMQSMHEANLAKANQAFLTLQTKTDDTEALKVLKEKNPALYELYSYTQATKNNNTKTLAQLATSKNSVISDASRYTQGVLEHKSTDSKLYKEMSIIEDAYLAIKSGDIKSANAKLDLIPQDTTLSMLASLLKHSTLKAK